MVKPIEMDKKEIYKIQTFKEAQQLAEKIARSCENPTLAQIALFELFSNGIEHGNLGISTAEKDALQKSGTWLQEIERRLSLPENQSKYLEIELIQHNGELELVVRDQGPGFNWQQYQKNQAKQTESHGRGILMAKAIAFSRLVYNEAGNQATVFIQGEKKT